MMPGGVHDGSNGSCAVRGRRLARAAGALAALAGLLVAGTLPTGAQNASVRSETAVNFNFDEVDVRTFVKLVGDLTGRTFIIDDAVKGKVTVVTPHIQAGEVYPLFIKILESVGCAAIEDGKVTRIVPFAPRVTAGAPLAGKEMPGLGLVTKVMPVKYAAINEVRRMLEALAGREKGGAISALESSSFLVVSDTPPNLRRLEQLIAEIDKPGAGMVYEVVRLKYIDAKEIAEQLTPVFARTEIRSARDQALVQAAGQAARPLAIVASPHSNSLILIGSAADVAELKKMVAQVDVESPTGGGTLHAIFLKYLTAEDAAKSLNALLSKPAAADKGKPAGSVLERRIAIEASAANNALLVDAGSRDFEVVQALVAELDKPVEQVLIEVVIAEMTLTDESELGVEMSFMSSAAKVGDVVVQGSSRLTESSSSSLMNSIQNGLFPRGITIGVAHGSYVDSSGKVVTDMPGAININAVDKKGKYKILSSVPLLAQNNKEASVNVVDNIPILKSTISGGSGTARDVIENIERIDVGIKLKLTPHINPDGEVRMVLNPSIEAILNPSTTGTDLTPTIAKREVSTTVTVPNRQTIVISGLIRDNRSKTVSRTPILGYIPLIGWLFRHSIDSVERTNLLIFVTPKVVTDIQEARRITDQLQDRTGIGLTNITEKASGQ
jgi:general secretion pathway protein D